MADKRVILCKPEGESVCMLSPISTRAHAARQLKAQPCLLGRNVFDRKTRRLQSSLHNGAAAFRHGTANVESPIIGRTLGNAIANIKSVVDDGLARLGGPSRRGAELRLLLQVCHVAASLAFVALYIWSTYQPAARGSWRHTADLALSALFAFDLAARIKSAGSSWLSMLLSPLSLLDVLSFAPGLLELCGAGCLGAELQGVRLDLRWFRIFRALRLLRLCLLTGNLPLMKLSRSALLSGAVNVRLMQLVASVLALLFTSASLVHAVERLPWHDALYFVTTTLTTVGYGDVVVKTTAGRLIVLVFMAVGVVVIPVRTSQLWAQLASSRLTAGTLAPGRPVVMLSSRLTEVRGFADLTDEFFHQVHHQRFVPHNVHLMVLGNKPSHEFMAFQELHDHRITLVEGSVLSARDLVRCRAEAAKAVLVLGDRFANDAAAEDLDVLFRVWAIKSYTKCVPLTVQVLRASSLAKVSPFLDPHQDVVMSAEQMRHRLLALSALCPGASTLLGNLLHTAQPTEELQDSVFRPRGTPPPKLAGRSWFAEYVRGCGHDLHLVPVLPRSTGTGAVGTTAGSGGSSRSSSGGGSGLVGCSFGSVVSAAFRQRHVLVIGLLAGGGFGRLILNPPHCRRLTLSDQLVIIAQSERHAEEVRSPAVVLAAAAATQRSEAAAEAEGAVGAAATREAVGFGDARTCGSSSDGSSRDGGGAQVQQQQVMLQLQAAAKASAAAAAAAAQPPSADACNGGGGGGAARVKRYFPSLASWDEDASDCYHTEKEGTFFAGRYDDVSGNANSTGNRTGNSCSGGGDGGGGCSAAAASLRVRVPLNRTRYGLSTADPGGRSDSNGGGSQATSGSCSSYNSSNNSNGGSYSVSSSSSDGGGSGNGLGGSSGGIGSGSCNISNSSGASSAGVAGGGRTASGGGGTGNGGGGSSSPAFLSPSLDAPVVPSEGDIGAVHTTAAAGTAPVPPNPVARLLRNNGSIGSVSFSVGNSGNISARISNNNSSSGSSSNSNSSSGSCSKNFRNGGGGGGGIYFGKISAASFPNEVRVNSSSSSSNSGSSDISNSSGVGCGSSSLPTPPSPGYVSAAAAGVFQAVGHQPPSPMGRPYALVDAPWRQSDSSCSERRGHIILAGAIDSFVEFSRVLHNCAGMRDLDSGISNLEVVVLHPSPPESTVLTLGALGPTRVVRGSPADPRALQQAGAAQARCLVYLGHSERPTGPRNPSSSASDSAAADSSATSTSPFDYGSTSWAGVQADAEALLTCYGVGEESVPTVSEESADECVLTAEEWARLALTSPPQSPSAASGTARGSYSGADSFNPGGNGGGCGPYASSTAIRGHSVVEFSFTSSVRFLQPGLLLQGTSVWDESCSVGEAEAAPRRSWRQRREAELAAAQQGLVQWQTNIYYGAGRVVVPALVDTFTIQAFTKRNLLLDVMSELCGDDGRPQGTPLRLVPVPRELAGRPYRELFDAVVAHGSLPLGLYRSKSENPAWRLHYVSTNPAWEDVVSPDDKVFVLRPAE